MLVYLRPVVMISVQNIGASNCDMLE